MDSNVSTLFDAIAAAIGAREAVACGEAVWSWVELERRASAIAGFLTERGLRPGSRVAIDLYTGVEYLEVVYGCMKARLDPVNVNYRYQEAELRYLLADCGAAALVFDHTLEATVRAAVSSLPAAPVLVQLGGMADDGVTSYETALAGPPLSAAAGRDGDDVLLLYTGGTTGMPKATMWRHEDLLGTWSNNYDRMGFARPATIEEAVEVAVATARGPRRRIALPAAPLIHATGLFTALGSLMVGGMVVLPSSRTLQPAELWDTVACRRVTELTIVGDAFARPLVDALEEAERAGQPWDLSSLQMIASIGVTWSAEMKAALLERADVVLSDVLASSEGGPYAMAVTRRGDPLQTSRFVLAPGARLLDEADRDVVPGSGVVGVLAAPGFMPSGYLGDRDKTAATFRVLDGIRYAVPGDQATLEDDGSLVLLGRQSGVINTGGEKVFAEEVEQALCTHPRVRDALVVGVPDERWGKRVVALVAVDGAGGPAPAAEELADHVGARLARYKRPREVLFVPEIRRSPVGKADRRWAERTALDALAPEGA